MGEARAGISTRVIGKLPSRLENLKGGDPWVGAGKPGSAVGFRYAI